MICILVTLCFAASLHHFGVSFVQCSAASLHHVAASFVRHVTVSLGTA
jgi:hypothetical protein